MSSLDFSSIDEVIEHFENEIDRIGDANALVKTQLTIRAEEAEAEVAALRRMHESSEQGRKHEAKRADKAEGALNEIMRERNTWARQLADRIAERDNALDQVDTLAAQKVMVENDRDNLCVALDRLAEGWETRQAERAAEIDGVLTWYDIAAKDLRRVIKNWENS